MTGSLFGGAPLRLNVSGQFEVVDAQSGAVLARMQEAARVRSPRGVFLYPDMVQTPRITWALAGPDGTTQMYVDRAEHQKLNFLPPQTVLTGPDGAVLCYLDYEFHSPFNGGGKVQHDAQGVPFVAGVRLVAPDGRPLGDMLYMVTPQENEKPRLPDGQDARFARWVTTEGAIVAERRDGVVSFAQGVPGAWRAMVIGSFLGTAIEFHLPVGTDKGTEELPNLFPGYEKLHGAYAERQSEAMAAYRRPFRTRTGLEHRGGVQRLYLEHLLKIGWPVIVLVIVISLLFRFVF